jgi:glycosyltransferase involved in cell wall biosynthesis
MNASPRPLVSVVVPCYNQARFLGETIESALQQTGAQVEVIVVDDGSTDHTASVAAMYPAVRYLRQQNQGAAAARTAGLRASKGEYVIFLDSDDRLLADAIDRGVEYLTAHPDYAFVTGHVRLITEDGSPAGIPPQEHADTDHYIALLRSNFIWTPGVVTYRRSVFDFVDAFDSSAGGSADYELNIRIARRFPIGCHHQLILEYRQHTANMSSDATHMLRSAVSVRRSLRRHVAGDGAARRAWKAGIDIVQADFGARLIEDVKADLRVPGRRRRALRALLCLLRYYPAGLARTVSGSLRRRLRRAMTG